MKLEQVKKQWVDYVREFETTEEMDIENHINIALKVGGLLEYIDDLKCKLDE